MKVTAWRFILLVVFVFASVEALSHGGGLDRNGGHHNRKTGGYHCHREPCFSIQRRAREATQDAQSEQRAFSFLYNRDDWGGWIDEDGDCQSSRDEVLIRDAIGSVRFNTSRRCDVVSGIWECPYTGRTYRAASDLDVDHVVSLKWAHGHGGDSWPRSKKQRFANDLENLLAVEDNENQSKGFKGPDAWQPSVNACAFNRRFDRIVRKYGLQYAPSEARAIQELLSQCGRG